MKDDSDGNNISLQDLKDVPVREKFRHRRKISTYSKLTVSSGSLTEFLNHQYNPNNNNNMVNKVKTDNAILISNSKCPPLHEAVKNGDFVAVDNILKRLSTVQRRSYYGEKPPCIGVNEKDFQGETALIYAAKYDKIDMVKKLISHGADVNLESTDGSTPLLVSIRNRNFTIASFLLENSADGGLADNSGRNSLHMVAAIGNIELLKHLLEKNSSMINNVDAIGASALHYSASQNNHRIWNTLLKCGAKIGLKTADGETALHFAADIGNLDFVKSLLDFGSGGKKIDLEGYLNIVTVSHQSALHLASEMGHVELVKYLISKGSYVNGNSHVNAATPLHVSAAKGKTEVVSMLLASGAVIHAKNSFGRTPLHEACYGGHYDIVKLLISKNAPISVKDIYNITPFLCAVSRNHNDVIKLLLNNGANKMDVDADGKMAAHYAVLEDAYDVLFTLLEKDGKLFLSTKDDKQRSPLHYAALLGKMKIVQLLLSKTKKLPDGDIDGRTPIHLATMSNNYECVSLLCQDRHSSVLDKQDKDGCTALHIAANSGSLALCELLIARGCSLDVKDNTLWTPLHHAIRNCDSSVANLLLRNSSENINGDGNFGNSPLFLAIISNFSDGVQMLLDSGVDLNTVTKENQNCLDIAIEERKPDVCKTIINHARWREAMKTENRIGPPIIEKLIESMPDVALLVLDRCVKRSDHHVDHSDMSIHFQYDLLHISPEEEAKSNNNKSYFAPVTMVKYSRGKLLSHSVTRSLLSTRWSFFGRYIYYLTLLLYILFLCSLSTVMVTHHRSRFAKPVNASPLASAPPNTMSTPTSARPINRSSQPTLSASIQSTASLKPITSSRPTTSLKLTTSLESTASQKSSTSIKATASVSGTPPTSRTGTRPPRPRRSNDELQLPAPQLMAEPPGMAPPGADTSETKPLIKGQPLLVQTMAYFTLVFILIQLLKELFQMYAQKFRYFIQLSNYMELAIYATAFVPIYNIVFGLKVRKETFQLGAVAIFLGFFNLVLFFQRFPLFRLYVTMFIKVCYTILRVLFIFNLLVLGFALAFYFLFAGQGAFRNVGLSFIRTLIMTIGEFDYTSMVIDSLDQTDSLTGLRLVEYPDMTYFFMIIFILVMPIAMVNLLIGLAVGDIEGVRQSATIRVLQQRIEFLDDLDAVLPNAIRVKIYRAEASHQPNKKNLLHRFKDWFEEDFSQSKYSSARIDDHGSMGEDTKARERRSEMLAQKEQLRHLERVLSSQAQSLAVLAEQNRTLYHTLVQNGNDIDKVMKK